MTLADGGRGGLGVEGILFKGCVSRLLLFWLFDWRKQTFLGVFFCTHCILRLLASPVPSQTYLRQRENVENSLLSHFLGLEVPSQPASSLSESCVCLIYNIQGFNLCLVGGIGKIDLVHPFRSRSSASFKKLKGTLENPIFSIKM